MIALLDVARQLLADVLRFVIVALRPTRIVAAENLFLRPTGHSLSDMPAPLVVFPFRYRAARTGRWVVSDQLTASGTEAPSRQ